MVWRNARKILLGTEVSLIEETCSKVIFFCNKQSLKDGICVHSSVIKAGIRDNLTISNNLLSLYAKCYGVGYARHLFDEMPYRDVVSWTALLSAYVKVGCHEEALELSDFMMINSGVDNPNEFTLSSIFRACSELRDAIRGTKVHASAIKYGFDSNHILTSCLIDFYSKCGQTEEAYKVFMINMQNADIVSWTTVISSFVRGGNWIKALRMLFCMIEQRVYPNEYTFAKILCACAGLGSICYGKLVHAQMIVWGVQLNLVLKTALVDMYAKCKSMADALKVTERTPERDLTLWTTLVTGFSQQMNVKEAINILRQMTDCGVSPNDYAYTAVLNACSTTLELLQLGKQVHSRVVKVGLESHTSVGNSLIDMYMKCIGGIGDAFQAFEGLGSPNVISWTCLIAGLVEQGLEDESFQAFERMRFSGVVPNSFTLPSILRACCTAKSVRNTKKLHGYLIKINIEKNQTIVANALVDTYAGLHMFDDAWQVAGEMNKRDTITYTSLATRLNQGGFSEMALRIINFMQDDDGVEMDGFTLSCFLSASANLGARKQGLQLHCYSIKSGLCTWISVSNGLIDFYSKIGDMNCAHEAFQEACDRDVVSWNSLIFGLAYNGRINSALSAFEDMILAGIKPDSVTLSAVLFSCNHGGLADMGLEYFHSMSKAHNIEPESDHYVCLVDLLGKAGRLQEAVALIEKMPLKPGAIIYRTMLNACKMHGDLVLGEDIARRGLEFDPCNPDFYLLLGDMYENAGLFDLREKILRLMNERGTRKGSTVPNISC